MNCVIKATTAYLNQQGFEQHHMFLTKVITKVKSLVVHNVRLDSMLTASSS